MKAMFPLTQISERVSNNILRVLSNGGKIIGIKAKRFSPHITVFTAAAVEATKLKRDYTPDIKILWEAGVKVKDIARLLGMSPRYIYDLLKK